MALPEQGYFDPIVLWLCAYIPIMGTLELGTICAA